MEQPIDNFSTKQQQNSLDRYCLHHSWAGGQCNDVNQIEERTRNIQH
jgi:hypothetical protein